MIKGVTKSSELSIDECSNLLKRLACVANLLGTIESFITNITNEYGEPTYILSDGAHVRLLDQYDVSRIHIMNKKINKRIKAIQKYIEHSEKNSEPGNEREGSKDDR